ncbi:MAG TPA: 3-oxoacyl-[acyl-carrier-protein] synthase III C-terminal domain-containing protein [Pseudonocardiaceae bacterium]|nr:3-oxoacyl-[acyl-carrier-protein] synthase III C-terminal domain-containing protein [Pseudonocardiaceae bacterium]
MRSAPSTMIESVATYLPPHEVSVGELKTELGVNDNAVKVYERVFGLRSVRLERETTIVNLLLSAASQLDGLAGRQRRIRVLIHARTIEPADPRSGSTLSELRRRLGLDRAVAFALSQHACASGLLAIDVAAKLLATIADPGALALVVTGEKVYPHVVRLMAPVTVVGDGAAACLVRLGTERDVMCGYATRTHGAYFAGFSAPPEVRAKFQREYPGYITEVVEKALDEAGVRLPDVALVLPDNTRRNVWLQWSRMTGFPVDRILLDNLPVTGHCFCADHFLNYDTARRRRLLEPGSYYIMAATGQGGIFSAAVFRH